MDIKVGQTTVEELLPILIVLGVILIFIAFCIINAIITTKKRQAQNNLRKNERTKAESTSAIKTTVRTHKPSTNCDGCPNQNSCKYGYVIYDDFDGSRLTLLDKYIMVFGCSDLLSEIENKYSDVLNPNEFTYDKKKLELLSDSKLERRLKYIEEERFILLSAGKCGRAQYNDLNRKWEIKTIQEILQSRN